MPGGIEEWRARMQAMPRQPGQMPPQGMAGLGAAAGMFADRFRNRGQSPQMPGGGQPMPEQAPEQPPQPQAPAAAPAAPPQQQTGMAGLGQAARGLYNKARVNALRGGGGRAAPGNMQEV
jgi:hypothetical protein